jgi:hypothetical protein
VVERISLFVSVGQLLILGCCQLSVPHPAVGG